MQISYLTLTSGSGSGQFEHFGFYARDCFRNCDAILLLYLFFYFLFEAISIAKCNDHIFVLRIQQLAREAEDFGALLPLWTGREVAGFPRRPGLSKTGRTSPDSGRMAALRAHTPRPKSLALIEAVGEGYTSAKPQDTHRADRTVVLLTDTRLIRVPEHTADIR